MKRINEVNLKNKTVIIRVDYNVPITDGKIDDDTRIIASLRTINYLIELLKKDGINSKRQVVDLLQGMTLEQMIELRRDLNELIRKEKEK